MATLLGISGSYYSEDSEDDVIDKAMISSTMTHKNAKTFITFSKFLSHFLPENMNEVINILCVSKVFDHLPLYAIKLP